MLAVAVGCLAGCDDYPSQPPPPSNRSPAATIFSPATGAIYEPGELVQLQGTGTDPEDGALVGGALGWSSSLSGFLGTGQTVTIDTLATGEHTIILTATDSEGATGADTVRIQVLVPPPILPLRWISLPAGSFLMGSPPDEPGRDEDEGPEHTVSISAFSITQTEVTTTHYATWLDRAFARGLVAVTDTLVVGSPGGLYPGATYLELGDSHIAFTGIGFTVDGGHENFPVLRVTWYGASAFCQDQDWRLPTEAEWEYACRAGTSTALYNGAITELECGADPATAAIAWYCSNSDEAPHPVREKEANAFGLYDMSGNALEWVNDWYGSGYYGESPFADPPGPENGAYKVARGGDWGSFGKFCRSASRVWRPPSYLQSTTYGFRAAR